MSVVTKSAGSMLASMAVSMAMLMMLVGAANTTVSAADAGPEQAPPRPGRVLCQQDAQKCSEMRQARQQWCMTHPDQCGPARRGAAAGAGGNMAGRGRGGMPMNGSMPMRGPGAGMMGGGGPGGGMMRGGGPDGAMMRGAGPCLGGATPPCPGRGGTPPAGPAGPGSVAPPSGQAPDDGGVQTPPNS